MSTSRYFPDVRRLIESPADWGRSTDEGSQLERYYAVFLVFAFASGTLAHLLPAVYPVTRLTTDGLLLVINGGLLYLVYRRNGDARLCAWLLFAYLVTFLTEVAGVATGAVFGSYQYGPTMWWQGWGVPFVIALNWAVLVLAANDLVDRFLSSPWLGAALAGIIVAGYDFFIEPVAIQLDYWQWEGGGIPVQNYLAWAAVGFLISLPLRYLRIRYRSPLLPVYLVSQLLFFLLLNRLL